MSKKKILTVSYGAFSCTLEGFDDSFDTMKAIAEYFRDLAAEDRHFGAVPTEPDAGTLARIAEGEIARRVDAQPGEDGVHLHAGQAAEAAGTEPDTGTDDTSQDVAAGFFAQCAPQDDPIPVVEGVPTSEARPTPDSVAYKLQRLRAAVSKAPDTTAAYSEDEHADAILDTQDAEPDATITDVFAGDAGEAIQTSADDQPEPDAGTEGLSDEFEFAEVDGQPAETAADPLPGDAEDDEPEYAFSSFATYQDEEDVDTVSEPVDAASKGVTRRQEGVATKEDELDRLMAEADHQMDEPESTNRRAAFEQMRAAVAATLADDRLGTEGADDETDYRTDLAAAVAPRPPVAPGRRDRPGEPRPAPLRLVAEQRIDVPSAALAPARPKRVAASAPHTDPDDTGFADYATSRGARDLPDLLEAAAAYLSFVEGREEFSRPQVMNKVLQLDPDGFSREDGLRHFGQLLRAGKIEKLKGGRFTASDDIGFRPDGKRAAG